MESTHYTVHIAEVHCEETDITQLLDAPPGQESLCNLAVEQNKDPELQQLRHPHYLEWTLHRDGMQRWLASSSNPNHSSALATVLAECHHILIHCVPPPPPTESNI